MRLALLLPVLALHPLAAPSAPPAPRTLQEAATEENRFVSLYREYAASGESAKLATLWKTMPERVLSTIDQDLEGSLRLLEEAEANELRAIDMNKVEEMQQRALFGARAAAEATGHPILLDYASSFVGWTPLERKSFRAGQTAFSLSRRAFADEKWEKALSEGQRCLDLAAPLGDWWGTAMGLAAVGAAHAAKGDHAQAASFLGRARLLNHDLGLTSSEYRALQGLANSLRALGRTPRYEACLPELLRLAKAVGDIEGAKRWADLVAGVTPPDEEAAPRDE
ncbi:MAG: hypothetical protein AAF368_14350 [Planctomycetota bacterium]